MGSALLPELLGLRIFRSSPCLRLGRKQIAQAVVKLFKHHQPHFEPRCLTTVEHDYRVGPGSDPPKETFDHCRMIQLVPHRPRNFDDQFLRMVVRQYDSVAAFNSESSSRRVPRLDFPWTGVDCYAGSHSPNAEKAPGPAHSAGLAYLSRCLPRCPWRRFIRASRSESSSGRPCRLLGLLLRPVM